MKQIQVSERAAALIALCRDPESLNVKKGILCDLLCSIVDVADEHNIPKQEFLPLMVAVSDYVEMVNELSKTYQPPTTQGIGEQLAEALQEVHEAMEAEAANGQEN